MKRARKRPWVRWAIGGLVGAIFLIFARPLVFGEEGLIRYFELRRELAEIQERITLVREQNAELRRRLEMLRRPSRVVLEEEARRHHLVGPHEELYEVEVK